VRFTSTSAVKEFTLDVKNDQKDVHFCYQGFCSLLFHNPEYEIEISDNLVLFQQIFWE
jgi:hypothetical protein